MSLIGEAESVVIGGVEGVAVGGPVGAVVGAAEGAAKGLGWKVYAAIAVAVVLGIVAWRMHAFVARAEADHAAVATLTGQRDTAVAAANSNAAAMQAAEAQHAAVIQSATAAESAARARAASLAQTLETLRHAPRSACTPSPFARGLLDRLRQ